MIEEIEYKKIFTIEKERLIDYFERIKSHFQDFTSIQMIAKFLNSQSIGASINDLMDILNYFKDKLRDNKDLLDFAFEWIRAQRVRTYYIMYLGSARFPDYDIAIDACIFLFFLKYDKYLRDILKNDVKEYEISSIYNIFFHQEDLKHLNFLKVLEDHKSKVPTIFSEANRININIFTIKSGLMEVIKKDCNNMNPNK